MHELHAIVSGRVQMVMMRDYVQRSARSLGLNGYVKNLMDGTVEVLAQGDRKQLEALVEKLRKGSLLARVDDVQVEWRRPGEQYNGFNILY